MKKINYILCAIALAGAVMFASCKQEAPQYNFVTGISNTNQYSVSGTVTTVIANKTVNAEGVAGTADSKTTTVKSITAGYSRIEWEDSKVREGNVSDEYTITFSDLFGTVKQQVMSGETEVTPFPTEVTAASQTLEKIYLYKIDDAFFIMSTAGEAVKVTAGDIESGDTFNLKISYSLVTDNAGEIAEDSKVVNTTTETISYDLTFTAK